MTEEQEDSESSDYTTASEDEDSATGLYLIDALTSSLTATTKTLNILRLK